MAKLPKVKNKMDEVEEGVILEESTTTDTDSTEDQDSAVDSIINHTAETVSSFEGADQEDETEEGSDSTKDGFMNTTPPDDSGVVVSAPKNTVPTKATTVRVATVCDHSCYIGGKPYHFKKGVPTNVPEPVKQILKNAGLLAAL